MNGLSTEIENLYNDNYYTVKNILQSDVNSEKLSFSGDLQTSIGTSLASAQTAQGLTYLLFL